MVRAALAIVSFVTLFVLVLYYEYLQWFVHPEYTRPEMFWAYWHILALSAPFAIMLFIALPGGETKRKARR